MNEKKVCFCVLNYNQPQKTIRCIGSILLQSIRNFLIVLIDNHSDDRSINLFREYFIHHNLNFRILSQPEDLRCEPESLITLIKAKQNRGYSAGNNIGLTFAKKNTTITHTLVVNNDVVFEENFLETLLGCAHKLETKLQTHSFALGATETDMNGKNPHSGFHYLNLPSGLVCSFRIWPFFRYLAGSCLLLPIDTPLMDEKYFLYYDDCAYSKILLQKGFLLTTCPEALYRHEKGGTTGSRHAHYQTIYRSMKRFYKMYYPRYLPVVIASRFFLNLLLGRISMAIDLIQIACQRSYKVIT